MSRSRLARACCAAGLAALSVAAPRFASAADWKAGAASVAITPAEPIWLAGYASRNRPSEGKAQDLYARALALEDEGGGRVVVVSVETLGLTAAISDEIAARVHREHGIAPDRVFLMSTHTHAAPVLRDALRGSYELDASQAARVDAYTRFLQDSVVAVVGRALSALSPATLAIGTAQAAFGVNRRVATERGITFGVNPEGPTDADVRVLRVEASDGRVRALLFGYACHNTTLTGDFYQTSGDYAGFAAADLERTYPGSVALFVMGAGADINPEPRGTLEHARAHGAALARAIERLPRASMTALRGRIAAGAQKLELTLTVPEEDDLRDRLNSDSHFRQRHAKRMLERLSTGGVAIDLPYAVRGLQLGEGLTFVALPGEVVVDYARRLKREIGAEGLWVAAYAHDVPAYIPSERILREGGYEADFSMVYYDLPGPFAPGLEDKIVSAVHDLRTALRARLARRR
jgi:neutral ceramidase